MKTLDEVITIMDGIDQTCTCCAYQHDCDETECIEKDALYYLKDLKNLQEDYNILYDKYWREYNQQQANPALAWDEVKQMIGKPLWVETDNGGLWGILQEIRENDNAYLIGVEDGLPINIFCPRISVNTWNVYRKERS